MCPECHCLRCRPEYHGLPSLPDRRRVTRLLGGILAVAVLAGAAVAAYAAPKAPDARACELVADMAVTARALAEEKVDRAAADRVMNHVYAVHTALGAALMKAITDTAFMSPGPSPVEYSAVLFDSCMRNQGDMDGVLGRDS